MSADLFAEFGSLAPTPPNQQQRQDASKQQPPATAAPADDPFGFSSLSFASPSSQTSTGRGSQQQWPAFQAPVQAPLAVGNVWGDLSALSRPAAAVQTAQDRVEDDDGWGDFETAESTQQPAPKPAPAPPLYTLPISRMRAAADPEPQRTRILRASTMDLISNNLIDVGGSSQPAPTSSWTPAPASQTVPAAKQKASDPNVLFDAENLNSDDDDEFGEFEDVTAPDPAPAPAPVPKPTPAAARVTVASHPPLMDLLSLDDIAPSEPKSKPPPPQLTPLTFGATVSPYPQAPRSPSFQERNPFPGLAVAPKAAAELKSDDKANSPSPMTAWPAFDEDAPSKKVEPDDEWAAFEDLPVGKPEVRPASPGASNWDWDSVDVNKPAPAMPKDDEAPPINIPPPSILLSVFPQLLDLADPSLYAPLASKPTTVKQKVLSDPTALTFLRGYLALSTVAARIIAGRKLRWNRDRFLAKGMSISAAGSKGMKLAGIDRAQATREDREAADVVAAWKAHVGKLRSVVAAANSAAAAASQLRVPELSETMTVQTAKVVPTAPKPCVICGLKRDERVLKVDYDVEDSFGEWWVEHWGHRACKNFWIEHEKQLRQR